MTHESYEVTMIVSPPIKTIYNANHNLTTNRMMTNPMIAPIAPLPGKEDQAAQAAAVAEVVDTLGSFLTATGKKGKHMMDLHDSLIAMHVDLETINGELHSRALFGTELINETTIGLQMRRELTLNAIQAEKRQFMWALQELVKVTVTAI